MTASPAPLLDLLISLTRSLRAAFELRVRAHGLTFARARLLTTIGRNQGASQADLAAMLDIETPTLKRLLDALEAQGLAERRPIAGDARKHAVYLTETASIAPLLGFRAEMDAALTSDIPPEDIEITRRTLARMGQNAARLAQG
ncbi:MULTISPECIES: MarR family winged helix-turn-helix transcriptional regulator [unclassified Paracoccus (in: a-proteobacteria)]|uniref:MarR family winged helix-turn-helix transcriptional regulator n=1 Tax=unclassified Paracoccus (in: a-proteobacteria) TaxID=2688777 RepID=UPI0012B42DD1|nr:MULTISPECIES: MarR family transcriptional regulator [unclassified Paracoccus (in: a-proteobacteria)]UXU75859.1 MarR family transcriptional regulator [Paracoccus sp. SMMA_5]UXU81768.1 MarR family transcriptional regulator [Paracoccus sp. SMMA_5_TC]